MTKILIIRLSSIGDIIQCMGIIGGLRHRFPDAQIHWITRSDMVDTLSIDKRIDKIWSFDKREGLAGLLRLCGCLKREGFDYIYDAHNNIRSAIIKGVLRPCPFHRPGLVVRSKDRFKRFLLFKFGINRFDWPFIGVDSFRKPLSKWGVEEFPDDFNDYRFAEKITSKFEGFITEKCVTLIPSANWKMKRWPVERWQELIRELPDCNFVILGGPTDYFCEQIAVAAPQRVRNMAGKCSIMESSYIVAKSNVVVSGDTGFMHSADLFRTPTVALIGPTAFGFPARESTEVVALDMKCRPCTKDGRGACKDSLYQRCMADITAKVVAQKVAKILQIESKVE